MSIEQAKDLRSQLLQLAKSSDTETVLLPPAIPFDLDDESVALGSAAYDPTHCRMVQTHMVEWPQ